MPTAEEMAAALQGDPWAVAANRLRQGVKPDAGRPEGHTSQFFERYLPHVAQGLATLPERALGASEALRNRQADAAGNYDMSPFLETAGLMVGARLPTVKTGELGAVGGKFPSSGYSNYGEYLKSLQAAEKAEKAFVKDKSYAIENYGVDKSPNDIIAHNMDPPYSGWQAYPIKPGFEPLTLDPREWFNLPRRTEVPKSEAAQRLGFNVRAFHGTKTPKIFEEFRLPEDELGIHFGTPKAAQDRIGDLWNTQDTNRVYPAMLRANNPLKMRDRGTWTVDRILPELKKRGFSNEEINAALRQAGRVGPEIQGLRDLINSKGYDSVVYKNNVEDTGHKSYIIMDPARIRSPFAKFDPAKLHSRNLLAGTAGAAAAPALDEYVRALRGE